MPRPIALLALAALLGGCEIFAPGDCPLSVEPAIVVTITDALTGEPRAEGASGFVRDGEYTDSLIPSRFDGEGVMLSRQAAEERAGWYDIRVDHPGYERWSRSGVVVHDGECNVQTRRIGAELTPTGAG